MFQRLWRLGLLSSSLLYRLSLWRYTRTFVATYKITRRRNREEHDHILEVTHPFVRLRSYILFTVIALKATSSEYSLLIVITDVDEAFIEQWSHK